MKKRKSIDLRPDINAIENLLNTWLNFYHFRKTWLHYNKINTNDIKRAQSSKL